MALRLPEHSGPEIRRAGGWRKYHRLCKKRGLAGYNAKMESLVRLPQMATKKISRNSPCTCGSGKKYKKCCLKIGG